MVQNGAELADQVEAAGGLISQEKETTINFGGTEDRALVTSYKASVARSLLKQDHSELVWVTTQGDGRTFTKHDDPDPESIDDDHTIVGVSVTVPVGALTIKGKPRSNNHHSGVVST